MNYITLGRQMRPQESFKSLEKPIIHSPWGPIPQLSVEIVLIESAHLLFRGPLRPPPDVGKACPQAKDKQYLRRRLRHIDQVDLTEVAAPRQGADHGQVIQQELL